MATSTKTMPVIENKRRRRVMFEEEPEEEEEEDLEDDFPILAVENDVEEEQAKLGAGGYYHLTHVVRENKSRPIVALDTKQAGNDERFLILTIGGDKASVYEGKHMDLASHFVNEPNAYCKDCGDILCGTWILSDPNKNDVVFALGGVDGYVSVVSLAESRVVQRLKAGSEQNAKFKVVNIVPHHSKTDIFASLAKEVDSGKGIAQVWNAKSGKQLSSFPIIGDVKAIAFAPVKDEDDILAALLGDELLMFNATSGKEIERRKLPFKSASFKFMGDADSVYGVSLAGVGYTYNFQTKDKKTPFVKTAKMTCMAASPCNKFLVAGSDDQAIAYVANLETGEVVTLKSSRLKNYKMTNCAFSSSDHSNLVFTSHDGTLWRWQLRQKASAEQNA